MNRCKGSVLSVRHFVIARHSLVYTRSGEVVQGMELSHQLPQHYLCAVFPRKKCPIPSLRCLLYLSPWVWFGCGGEGSAVSDGRARPLVRLCCANAGAPVPPCGLRDTSRSCNPRVFQKGEITRMTCGRVADTLWGVSCSSVRRS